MKNNEKVKMKEPYRVTATKFIGYGYNGSATYEITFNKSLEHTGRFTGIERGLNAYVSREKYAYVLDSFKQLLYSVIGLFRL